MLCRAGPWRSLSGPALTFCGLGSGMTYLGWFRGFDPYGRVVGGALAGCERPGPGFRVQAMAQDPSLVVSPEGEQSSQVKPRDPQLLV